MKIDFKFHFFLSSLLCYSWKCVEIAAIKSLKMTKNAIAVISMSAKVIHVAMPSRANWKVRPNVPTVYAVIIARYKIPDPFDMRWPSINGTFSFSFLYPIFSSVNAALFVETHVMNVIYPNIVPVTVANVRRMCIRRMAMCAANRSLHWAKLSVSLKTKFSRTRSIYRYLRRLVLPSSLAKNHAHSNWQRTKANTMCSLARSPNLFSSRVSVCEWMFVPRLF